MSAKEFTNLLVEYIVKRAIQGDRGHGQDFSEKIWTDIKRMFWELRTYVHVKKYDTMIQTMCDHKSYNADYLKDIRNKVLCMEVGKIFYYMEGLNKKGTAQSSTDPGERKLWNYLRCIIGTWTLMSLHGKQCKIKEITTHVSSIMNMMEASLELGHNREKCAWVTFEQLKIGTRLMGAAMDEWITEWKGSRARITHGISGETCHKVRETTIGGHDREEHGTRTNIEITKSEDLDTVAGWIKKKEYLPKDRVNQIIEDVGASNDPQNGGNKIKDEIETWEQERARSGRHSSTQSDNTEQPQASKPAATAAATSHGSIAEKSNKKGDHSHDNKEDKKNAKTDEESKIQQTPPQTKGAVAGATELGRADSPAPDVPQVVPPSQVEAPASPVLPARPPPPPPPPRRPSTPRPGPEGAGQPAGTHGTSTDTKAKDSDAKSPGKATCPGSNGTSTGVSISCETTSDEALGMTPQGKTLLAEADKTKEDNTDDKHESSDQQDSTSPPSEQTPRTPPPEPEPEPVPTTSSNGAEAASPGPRGPPGNDGDAGGQAIADGGNDDPPPLNPPKPKPNPNPDQSGSSGGTGGGADQSSGGTGGGVSGGQGKRGGGGGHKDGGAGAGVGGGTRGSSGGGRAAPTPTTPSVPPGLTWADVTPYTPALIPAMVGIGVIAFFLWKYFAHLGHKRRRTYRTVRDVPSPPLDEEILQHLQRGHLPPPVYGYTMVRDRQPCRLPAARRRRRPPRVRTRTIIELHLEVLNECDAAEWENVKDDYLQILVEQFMGGNNTCTSSSDVCTPDDGLATQDSTTNAASPTRDPPTYSDGTDTCPPNEEDRWNCIKNIQLPTDPCPPTDDDPWSCMENIQLQRARSPPNADDPDAWRCMETIQLETDHCPPHAHDPDPWSCMETIHFATDTSPPNEQDPDPWSCMENIQLATDPSASNDEDYDPWSCMETIQLEHEHTPSPLAYSSDPGNDMPALDRTKWIPWIDRNKHLLQACTTQPWFLQLKADWKQYQLMKKLHAWKQWVEQQHRKMSTYKEEAWFKHLLHNVQEATVSEKGEVSVVEKDLEVDKVMAAEDLLQVSDVPRSQPLPQQPYMKKSLTAQTWILILALVIEQCEVERSLQDRELYVDDLLQKL
ncbi:hypothetical protein AK88_05463 [Plasmodium fragile]|uniref:Schizont-infected cell agglutination C-terminal domain-containing protein n=1 Tax=Plasmodium fragile TaxID=5857 RepID=A0A0D9QDI7_PLAFR|nr:uncharacterized protein AK88_05463 [Plasmodium fragile]KJP84902.1 hypothetical protein AK88_05463 [Plasmodium fragile]